jgi:hypothetical protein
MRRISLFAALAVVTAGVAAAVALGAGGRSSAPAGQPGLRFRPFLGVNFVSQCGFSHRLADDPIVFPGQPGRSHDHTFVGNTSTDAGSTLASMLAAGTTCRRPGDTAGYWVPTLLANGEPIEPVAATIYYRRRTIAPLTPFPAGLKMIAGDSHATAAQSLRVTFWNCGALAGVPPSSTPPDCPGAGRRAGLRLHVTFPDCWDGLHLDSADHMSHMAYSERGRCTSTHPVEVPSISLILRYPVAGGNGLELASGGVYSAHADFFNAWRQAALSRLVDDCLNALRHCGRVG